ncbi:MAG: lytic transglycosylase domain-containing protein [Myxococcaceae bacterium]
MRGLGDAGAHAGATPIQRLFSFLSVATTGCGKLPLVAGLALVLALRLSAWGPVEFVAPVANLESLPPADFQLIDTVLAKRAPELGLTLRRQLGIAISEEAQKAGYDPLLILAVIDVESDFSEGAVSEKGARGLMQIQPTTLHFLASKEGLQLARDEVAADPVLCVRLGIRYLRDLQNRFGGDLDMALMAYNAGPTKLRQAVQAGRQDVFRSYPQLVQRDFRRFRRGVGLGSDWALAQRRVQALRGL